MSTILPSSIHDPARRGVEWVLCNLCGADDPVHIADIPVLPHHRGVYGRDEWPLVRCRCCGLHYHNPRFDAAARDAFYQFTVPDEANYIQRWFVENADLQRPTWQRVARVLQTYRAGGKLLDVGCGPGWFLSVARDYGYHVVGQDISPPMVHLAATQYQLAVEPTIDTAVAQHGQFDVVTSFDVIEHHEDPLAMLREIHTALRPDGILLLTTHDIGNWFARYYGPKWRQINPIGHITYFDQRTLTLILERAGFQVLRFGGWHTIAETPRREAQRWLSQMMRTIIIRGLFITLYAPLANRYAPLRTWQLNINKQHWNHEKLMLRVGGQVIMNDDIVVIAQKI
jgi:2-polyprenyl-3-methyl-5-hydroxy-6-metoxy-1,4-benzoquinol methylase